MMSLMDRELTDLLAWLDAEDKKGSRKFWPVVVFGLIILPAGLVWTTASLILLARGEVSPPDGWRVPYALFMCSCSVLYIFLFGILLDNIRDFRAAGASIAQSRANIEESMRRIGGEPVELYWTTRNGGDE
jgi:hypothetical protein